MVLLPDIWTAAAAHLQGRGPGRTREVVGGRSGHWAGGPEAILHLGLPGLLRRWCWLSARAAGGHFAPFLLGDSETG